MWMRGNDRRTKQADQPNEMQKKYPSPYVVKADTIRTTFVLFCFSVVHLRKKELIALTVN